MPANSEKRNSRKVKFSNNPEIQEVVMKTDHGSEPESKDLMLNSLEIGSKGGNANISIGAAKLCSFIDAI
eukprot:3977265-Amphidinium_carterae.1